VSQEPVTTTFKGSNSPSEYIGDIAKQKSGSTLSPGAKGGIAGGIVGGLAAIILAFVLWRMCRGRGKKLPPP
jgi:cobalamin biosynthesis Mg chelatase CobN